MGSLDSWGESYLLSALRLDRHIPGYVDAYTGPAALREAVGQEVLREPAGLLADVGALQRTLGQQGYAAGRQRFLEKQLRAMEATVRKLLGEVLTYRQEVELFFDITPPKVEEGTLLLLHEEGRPAEEVVAYMERYGLRKREEAESSLRFMQSPLFRAYIFVTPRGSC